MFFAQGTLSVGPAVFRSHLAVDRAIRVFALERSAVTFDSSLLPPTQGPAREVCVLWFVLSGEMSWRGPSSGSVTGRGAVAIEEHQFDGCRGKRAWTFRSSGSPFRALEIRVPRAFATVDAARGPVVTPLGVAAADAVERYLSRALGPGVSSAEDPATLVEVLVAEAALSDEASRGITTDEDPRLVRLWDELARAYGKLDTRPSLKRLAVASGMSLRTFSRFVSVALNDLLLPPGSWREGTATLRLMLAVLFLSCPELSVLDVSSAVGYARPEAMANAFQRAGLLSPRDVRLAFAASRG